MNERIYEVIAGKLLALENCENSSNTAWWPRHKEALDKLMQGAPSGSGVDSGTRLLLEESNCEKLVFQMDFHHMDEHGYYDGWTHHRVTVRPSLFHGITLRISGPNRNEIKEHLSQLMQDWLTGECADFRLAAA